MGRGVRIEFLGLRAYMCRVGQPTMAIHGLRNKRCGPGGSTRRLHHFRSGGAMLYGGETGSTRVVKARSVARYDTTVIGSKFSCERQLRTGGARGLIPRGIKAKSNSRFEGHRATEAPHSPVDHPPA